MSGRRPHMRGTLGHPGANGWDRLLALAGQLHAEQETRRAGGDQPGTEPESAPAPRRRNRGKRGRR